MSFDKSNNITIIFNKTNKIMVNKSLVLKNWENSKIAEIIISKPDIKTINFNIHPVFIDENINYILDMIFNKYIKINDDIVPEPSYIKDFIKTHINCGSKEHYNFIIKFGEEICVKKVFSKYPELFKAILKLNNDSEDFWNCVKCFQYFGDVSSDDKDFFVKFNSVFSEYKFEMDKLNDKIIENVPLELAFRNKEYEAVIFMAQIIGSDLFGTLATFAELIGLYGLMKIASSGIGLLIKDWYSVEKAINS